MAFVLRFSSKVVVFFAVLLIMVSNMELQGVMGFKEKLVGGHHGWHLPDANETDFYNVWASKTRFHIGDSLRFQYQNDSVLVVDKFGYYHCDTTKATSTYNDGNTLIKLEQPGFMYFISGSPDNCHNGQRLVVDVMSPHPAPIAVPPASSTGQAVSPGPAQHDNSGPVVHVSALLFVGLVAGSAFLL